MAFSANDGSKHTNMTSMKTANARHMASAPAADPSQGSTPPPIEQNQQAMDCVQQLQQMGYTADDVAQAMQGGQDSGGYQEGY